MYITKGNVQWAITVWLYYCALYNTVYNRKHETAGHKEQLLFRLSGNYFHLGIISFPLIIGATGVHNTTEDPGSNLNPPIFSHEQVLIPSAVADRCAIVPPTIKRFPSIYPVYLKIYNHVATAHSKVGFCSQKMRCG